MIEDLHTTFRFTGQRKEDIPGWGEGLYFYNARWYDPALSRFLSADSIIPNVWDPVAFDRYAYVRNSPAMYTDPSGHRPCDQEIDGECISEPGWESGWPYPGLLPDGKLAFKNMNRLEQRAKVYGKGRYITGKDWLTYTISTEYMGSIGNYDGWNAAIARRYREYCSEGPYSVSCYNGFWGYMQAIHSGDEDLFIQWMLDDLSYFEQNTWSNAEQVAIAILNPDAENNVGITKEMDHCYGQICDWVTILPGQTLWTKFHDMGDDNLPSWVYSTVDGYSLLLTEDQKEKLCIEVVHQKDCNLSQTP